jgi:MFS family permease
LTADGAGPRSRLRGAARLVLADVTPLRDHPAFRRLWIGETISSIGGQVTLTAVQLQVYAVTGSSFAVGLLGLVALVPLVLFGLLGGAISDAMDRRRLALITSSALAGVSATLLALAVAGLHAVWPLYLVVGVQSALLAMDQPARRAMTPRLVTLEQLPAAAALGQVGFSLGVTVGPLLAGVTVAAAGYGFAYAVDVSTFVAALYSLARLPPMPPAGGGTRVGFRSVGDGFRFLGGQRIVLMTFVVDIIAMIFGMPRALFPQIAHTQFHGGTRTAGVLYSSIAVGALLGAALGGWLGRVKRQGLAVVAAIVVWGLAIALFGLTHALLVGMVLLATAGAADMVSAAFRTAILQTATPDGMQGRLQGVFVVVVTGGPRLGDLEAGSVAALASPTISVVSGGLACIGGVLIAAALVPSFARYDARRAVRAATATSTGAMATGGGDAAATRAAVIETEAEITGI